MGGSRRTIDLLQAVGLSAAMLLCSGCTSSPLASGTPGLAPNMADAPGEPIFPGPPPTQPGAEAPLPGSQATAPDGTRDPDALEEVFAQIQEMGVRDPAVRDRLLEDLKQADPNLRPLLVQQFRANLAWLRQSEQENADAGRPNVAPPADSSRPTSPAAQTVMRPEPRAQWPQQTASGAVRPPTNPSRPDDRFAWPPQRSALADRQAGADRSHTANVAPRLQSRHGQDARGPGQANLAGPPPEFHRQPPRAPTNGPMANSHASPPAADWRSHLTQAIRSLESEVGQSHESEGDPAKQARLRLLYLLAGQRDAALRPIPSLAMAMQEFWSGQLYGLATLLKTDMISEPSRRNAEAKGHLGSAVIKLGETCPLQVRNLAFATEIQSYGVFKPFETYEFTAGQTVLLYAEVENLQSKQTAKGFHTSSRSSYQILDSSGRRVSEHEFSTNEEYCRNPRRDFFISYQFCLPKQIFPGRHTLQLTVVDLNGQKIGQSTIEFTIRSADD